AERAVVHAAVVALGVIARVPAAQVEQPALLRAADHTQRGGLRDELGEQGDDVDAHRGQNSGSQSTTIRLASKSMDLTTSSSTNGSMRSRSPRTTSTSLAPVSNRCDTRPSFTPSTVCTSSPSRSTQ